MASNAPVPAKAPLSFMQTLSPSVFLHRPQAATYNPSAPKLIVVCSWMGAQDAHIAKYIAGYQAMFPSSSLLLVKCSLQNALFPSKAEGEIKPAIPALRAVLEETSHAEEESERPEVLVHLFSNGGCFAFTHIIKLYQESFASSGDVKSGEAVDLPRHVCVLDSCPGKFEWWSAHRAISQPLPGWMSPLVHLFILLQIAAGFFAKRDHGGDWRCMDSTLNSDAVLAAQERRVYVYSEGDDLVYAADVEEHAEEARKAGMGEGRVVVENFGKSRHVAHLKADPERYWGAVKGVWEGQ